MTRLAPLERNLFIENLGDIAISLTKGLARKAGKAAYKWAMDKTVVGRAAGRALDMYTNRKAAIGDAYLALTDQVEYRTVSQEELHRLAGSKYTDYNIKGLALDGQIYIDEEIDRNPGMRMRVLAHELGELRNYRPDSSNDEPQHVAIEVDVHDSFKHWINEGKGWIAERAYSALNSFYNSINQGASQGDELSLAVSAAVGA